MSIKYVQSVFVFVLPRHGSNCVIANYCCFPELLLSRSNLQLLLEMLWLTLIDLPNLDPPAIFDLWPGLARLLFCLEEDEPRLCPFASRAYPPILDRTRCIAPSSRLLLALRRPLSAQNILDLERTPIDLLHLSLPAASYAHLPTKGLILQPEIRH